MIAWLHTALTHHDRGQNTPKAPLFRRGTHTTQDGPAFALGQPGRTAPFLVATRERAESAMDHGDGLNAAVMGHGDGALPIDAVLRALDGALLLTDAAIGHWGTIRGHKPRAFPASYILSAWKLVVLRDAVALVDAQTSHPLTTVRPGTAQLSSWFCAPMTDDTPDSWAQALPALLFTHSPPGASAHARLEQQRRIAQDKALIAAHLGQDAFTWTHPLPMVW